MAKIYRLSDQINLAVGDLKIVISPLSTHQKSEVTEAAKEGTSKALMNASVLAVKYAVKDVKGLVTIDDGEYSLDRSDDGSLSDECVNDLFNTELTDKLSSICLALINGVPSEFYDPLTGNKLEGVEFIVDKESKGKKKKATSGK